MQMVDLVSLLTKIYQLSPPALRSVAATVRGMQLRRIRYGADTDQLIAEALERELWSSDRWQAWQEQTLPELLHHAATTVPFYREQWSRRRARGDRSSWEDIHNWPVLTKESVRQNPRSFLSEKPGRGRLVRESTSGTTGKPMEFWFSEGTLRQYYALHDCRLRTWNGVSRFEPWAIFGGQPVVRATARRPPYWVHNRAMRQVYFSANHVSSTTAKDLCRELHKFEATHIITYPSPFTYLAALCTEQHLPAPNVKVVLANAEPLFDWQKDIIARWLGRKPLETYGMAEKLVGASECEAGSLHLWPELGHTEIVDGESTAEVPAGAVGEIVATGFLSREMPLIRYQTGDRAAFKAVSSVCACGRTLPLVDHIEGRSADMLIAPDGRRIIPINAIFYGLPLVELQIIQEDATRLYVLTVPGRGFDSSTSAEIVSRLRWRVEGMEVIVKTVDAIPRGPNGKFRPVINRLLAAEDHGRNPGGM